MRTECSGLRPHPLPAVDPVNPRYRAGTTAPSLLSSIKWPVFPTTALPAPTTTTPSTAALPAQTTTSPAAAAPTTALPGGSCPVLLLLLPCASAGSLAHIG